MLSRQMLLILLFGISWDVGTSFTPPRENQKILQQLPFWPKNQGQHFIAEIYSFSFEADFTKHPDASPPRVSKFIPNPLPNWGPGSRAGGKKRYKRIFVIFTQLEAFLPKSQLLKKNPRLEKKKAMKL
jgi:hypothetical protein